MATIENLPQGLIANSIAEEPSIFDYLNPTDKANFSIALAGTIHEDWWLGLGVESTSRAESLFFESSQVESTRFSESMSQFIKSVQWIPSIFVQKSIFFI